MDHSSDSNFRFLVVLVCMLVLFTTLESCAQTTNTEQNQTQTNQQKKTIRLALLLDTSNSMDGLIDQAKAQLWTIVNELGKASCNGQKPDIKIALYEYGNSRLTTESGYIRMVTPLTSDLDKLSADLFGLTTNGGDEYCGQVIQTSLNQLAWNQDGNDLQMIFIAGNEPFTQGELNYKSACASALNKHVYVNTIFCGGFDEGIAGSWKSGADLTKGSYMSIEQNRKTVFIPSPYDDKISVLNDSLNKTYISFGREGEKKKEMQAMQDKNAESYGISNKVNRAISKSSSVYKNDSWDLVDAEKNGTAKVEEIQAEELPQEMKSMNITQRKAYINQQSLKRNKITEEINALNIKRNQFLADKDKTANEGSLDNAMIMAVRKQATDLNFKFD